jgi:hypothetical protein
MHHLHTGEEEEEESTPPGAKDILHCMHRSIACNNKRAPALINQTPITPQDHDICVLESSQVTLLRPSCMHPSRAPHAYCAHYSLLNVDRLFVKEHASRGTAAVQGHSARQAIER